MALIDPSENATHVRLLQVIPYTLAENAGLHPIQIVTELRNRHVTGEKTAGINVRKVCTPPPSSPPGSIHRHQAFDTWTGRYHQHLGGERGAAAAGVAVLFATGHRNRCHDP